MSFSRPMLLFGAFMGCALWGIPGLALGSVYEPLHAEFGWSRAQVAAGITLGSFGSLLLSPLVGVLLDRLGPRRLALVGVPLYAASFAGIGLAHGPAWAWIAAWAPFSAMAVLVSPIIWTGAVARGGFPEAKQGTAIAVVMAGSTAAGIAVPGLSMWIVSDIGWRMVYFLFALFPLLVVWPIAWFAIPDERRLGVREPHHAKGSDTQASWGAILRQSNFQLLIVAIALNALSMAAIMLHFVPMLGRFSMSVGTLALVAGIYGPASLAGRLAMGALMATRLPSFVLFGSSVVLPAMAAWLILLGPANVPLGVAGIMAIGVAQGTSIVFVPYFGSRLFEVSSFGRASSLLMSVFAIGFGIGPVLAGGLFDRFGSYTQAGWMVIAVSLVALVPAVIVGRRADARKRARG